MNRLALTALGLTLLSFGCGYSVAGHADTLPKDIKTIAIPAFGNATTLYTLANSLPADITREFISRTHYQIVTNPEAADAVLKGTIIRYSSFGTTLDPTNGRASSAAIGATIVLSLTDRATGKVIYSRTLEEHDHYEVSPDTRTYFEESGAALSRISRNVARDVVTAILEKF